MFHVTLVKHSETKNNVEVRWNESSDKSSEPLRNHPNNIKHCFNGLLFQMLQKTKNAKTKKN